MHLDIDNLFERSDIMRRVNSTCTKPERLVRRFLFHRGYHYRVNNKKLPGEPDIYILKYKVAIFIHGCFWHGHKNCKDADLPKSNIEYWQEKINKNFRRDGAIYENLQQSKINYIVVWTCELKNRTSADATLIELDIK